MLSPDKIALELPHIEDERVAQLVRDIDRQGHASLKNYITDTDLSRMRDFVHAAVARAGGTYVGFTGKATVSGSGLDWLADDPSFQSLFQRMYELAIGSPAPPVRFHQVLRCLAGEAAATHSYNFHYDSYVITALLPIVMPTAGRTGDFVMLPNTRRIRKSYVTNLLDKIALDNMLSQKALKLLLERRKGAFTRLKLIPGDLYFFWGYRSIHTNEPCDSDQVRSTALFHYANPHCDSALRRRLDRKG